jgi:hypothetical protein
MTDSSKSVSRVSTAEHTKHGRKIIVVVGPGDTVGLRLQRSKEDTTAYVSFEALFDIAEMRRAAARAGFSTAPCKNPKTSRNV